jgi:hypothetical protein
MRTTKLLLVAGVFLLVPVAAEADVIVGQIDTFEDGSESGWETWSDQQAISDGGPSGPGDLFFEINASPFYTSLGVGNNSLRWSGDYAAAGVTAIGLDLKPWEFESEIHLSLRGWGLEGYSVYTSTTPLLIEPLNPFENNGWKHVEVDLTEDQFTLVEGFGSFASVLSNVLEVSLYDELSAGGPGTPGSYPLLTPDKPVLPPPIGGGLLWAPFGIDNIVALPEPTLLVLLAAGLPLVIRRR